jgi:hypothetical protein
MSPRDQVKLMQTKEERAMQTWNNTVDVTLREQGIASEAHKVVVDLRLNDDYFPVGNCGPGYEYLGRVTSYLYDRTTVAGEFCQIALDKRRQRLEEPDNNETTERCPDCGRTPDEGACFYCKAD